MLAPVVSEVALRPLVHNVGRRVPKVGSEGLYKVWIIAASKNAQNFGLLRGAVIFPPREQLFQPKINTFILKKNE